MLSDHAQLFFMSTLIWTLDPGGERLTLESAAHPKQRAAFERYFPNRDKHDMTSTQYRAAATNIYRTKDNRYFHLHGSMNPEPTIKALGLPLEENTPSAKFSDAIKPFQVEVAKYTAEEMQAQADGARQAGTIAWSVDEYNASEHGKANEHVGLFEIHHRPSSQNGAQKASWWPQPENADPARPLAGLKVVDLTRVIASPAVSRGLAELGASIMRVTSPNITDMSGLHLDLNWGKWNCSLDLKSEEDREMLRDLIRDADVFLQGYRPHVLDKHGFAVEDVLKLVEGRDRGIVYARENCYGWNGPWMHRSGWQQISDAVSSLESTCCVSSR
jgi:hypothetical protein